MCASKSVKNADFFSNEFYSDMSATFMDNALLLRSPVVINGSFAFKTDELPLGYSIFSADDIPGKKEITVNGITVPVFAKDSILYKGQPVGIVTGPDVQVLKKICKSLVVTAAEEPSPGESDSQKTILTYETKSSGYDESLFPSSEHVISGRWISNLEDISINESEGAFIGYNDGQFSVFSHSSCGAEIEKNVSIVTGVEKSLIDAYQTKNIKKQRVYGWQTALLCAQVAVAAVKLKKSVKLVYSRQEQLDFVVRPMDVQVNHTTALDENGRIILWNIDVTVDAGNIVPDADQLIQRFETVVMGLYDCPEYRINVTILKTDNPPVSINYCSVDSYCNFALECHINKIADELDLDPVELRINNAYNDKDFKPFKSNKDSLVHLLTSITNKCDFKRKNVAYRLSEKSRYAQDNISPFLPPVRGIGLSCGSTSGTSVNENFFDLPATGSCVVEMDFEPSSFDITLRGVWLCINAGQISKEEVTEIKKKISICVRNVLFDLIDDHIVQSDRIDLLIASSTEKSRVYDNIASTLVPAAFINALSQVLAQIVNKTPVSKEQIYQMVTKAQIAFDEKMALLRLSQNQGNEGADADDADGADVRNGAAEAEKIEESSES